MGATVAEPQRQLTRERARSLWTRRGSPIGSDSLANPAGLLSDLDRELEFLMTPRGPRMDGGTTTDDACCTYSNESNCCPTVALSITGCCE